MIFCRIQNLLFLAGRFFLLKPLNICRPLNPHSPINKTATTTLPIIIAKCSVFPTIGIVVDVNSAVVVVVVVFVVKSGWVKSVQINCSVEVPMWIKSNTVVSVYKDTLYNNNLGEYGANLRFLSAFLSKTVYFLKILLNISVS